MRTVEINARGYRIGESHPRAVLTRADVEHLWLLRHQGWGHKRIAKALDVAPTTVRKVLAGVTWGHLPAGAKRVKG